ncbi:MAG: methionyl-tRNA formyltransferase [Clostridiales bacterium]|nr:methionyl-tRNA formyltransferase [Clostridiales bacterium]
MRVVFMGTPDFAAASLQRLLDERFEVVAVYTMPDKARGRGMKQSAGPVKELALAHGIEVLQPTTLRDAAAAEQLRALRPDVLAVVAYGRILPDALLEIPKYGAINVHGSLLPQYRGAAPIQWAVLNGDETTGVCTMHLASGMDTGDVIYTQETPIGEFETSGELFDRLKELGAALLCRTLRDLEAGTAPRTPQDHGKATLAPMITKEQCPIDWTRTPRQIVKHICGLQPWPVATMELEGTLFRVFSAEYTETETALAPGSVVSAGKQGIEIACGGGKTLRVTELQAPGKKRMRAADYLLGHPIRVDG